MATSARSIASLSLSFGLVHVPVKLYSATESGSEIRFNLLDKAPKYPQDDVPAYTDDYGRKVYDYYGVGWF